MLSNTYNIKDFTKTELFYAPTVAINGKLDLKNRTLTARYNGKSFIFIADDTNAALRSLIFYARNSRAISKSEERDLYSLVYEQLKEINELKNRGLNLALYFYIKNLRNTVKTLDVNINLRYNGYIVKI